MKLYWKTFISGFLAGAAICLGGFTYLYCKFNFGIAGTIIGSFLFAFGLYCICQLGLYLYTGKIGFIIDQKKNKILEYIGLLMCMLIGNTVATIIFGIITHYSISSDMINYISNIVINKNLNLGWLFCKSVGCGMLVFLAVYLYKNTNNEVIKLLSIFLPIGIFVLIGLDHCIANIYYIFSAFAFSWKIYLGVFISILGNSIGSILLYSGIKYINNKNKGNE